MSEKLISILENIKNGNINGVLNVDLKLEEYLSVDSNGITFLEYLLRNNIQISYHDQQKYKKSIDIAYIYGLCGKSLWSFDLSEKDLFSLKNGQRYIDFFAQKGLINSSVVKNIKEHIEIVDLVILNSSIPTELMDLNEKIIYKLLTKDINGVYPVEKYLNESKAIKYIIPLINDAEKLIEICNKNNNNLELMKFCNDDVLMHNISKNYTLLEELLNKNIVPERIKYIPDNIKFINILREKNLYQYLKNAGEKVLLMKMDSGKLLLEEIIERGYKIEVNSIGNSKTLAIMYKNKCLDTNLSISNELLLKPVDRVLNDNNLGSSTLLEYLAFNNYNLKLNEFESNFENVVKILATKGYYKLLENDIGEKNLLLEIEPDILVIDKLLEQNSNIDFGYGGFKSPIIANKLLLKNRFDLLVKGQMPVLFQPIEKGGSELYLDYLLTAIKDKKLKYNLKNLSLYMLNSEQLAKFILLIAKHDMIPYLKELGEEDLLKERDGKTLLEQLLILNSELTVNKVLSDNVKSNFKIAAILNEHGISHKDVTIPIEKQELSYKTINDFNSTLGIGPMMNEGDVLLKKVEELFLNDGKSDKGLISALITGYRNALFTNYQLVVEELRLLLKIKEENMDEFIYLRTKEGAYFKGSTGAVYCDNEVVSTLLHETGHALHFYQTNVATPENYKLIIEQVQQDPKVLKKTEEYANNLHKILDEVEKIVEQRARNYFEQNFTDEKIVEITKFLEEDKIQKLESAKELGLDKETLNILLSDTYTVDEYIKQQKRIFIKENVDAILRNEYGSFIAIGDILDAIYDGDLRTGILTNELGKKIKNTYGHGIAYYCDTEQGFKEMVANFASMVKSNDSRENLALLKNIVGDEMFNMISNFYYNNIVISDIKEIEESKSL